MPSIEERIEIVVEEINEILQKDGGFLQFVAFEEDTKTAVFRLLGIFEHDPMAMNTFRGGIEKIILSKIKEVRRIEKIY
ncbi:MAG: NifU family protein [Candidatus Kapaibacterium sp.]